MAWTQTIAWVQLDGNHWARKTDKGDWRIENAIYVPAAVLAGIAQAKPARDELLESLRAAKKFVDKASGTALGVAMSGKNHPNPSGTLEALSMEGIDLGNSLADVISKATAP